MLIGIVVLFVLLGAIFPWTAIASEVQTNPIVTMDWEILESLKLNCFTDCP